MSRRKDGLQAFLLDVEFFADPDIRKLRRAFGEGGPLYYIYLLCRAYRQGYYVEYTPDLRADAAEDLRCTEHKVRQMTDYLTDKVRLLTRIEREGHIWLTSREIQRRYQLAMKNRGKYRGVPVDGALWILKKKETEGFIQVRPFLENDGQTDENPAENDPDPGAGAAPFSGGGDFTEKSGDFTEKSPDIIDSKSEIFKNLSYYHAPTLEEVQAAAREMDIRLVSPARFYHYYAERDWTNKNKEDMRDRWRQYLAWWEEREKAKQGRGKQTEPSAPADPPEDFARTDEEKLTAMRKMYAHMKREGGNGHAEN